MHPPSGRKTAPHCAGGNQKQGRILRSLFKAGLWARSDKLLSDQALFKTMARIKQNLMRNLID